MKIYFVWLFIEYLLFVEYGLFIDCFILSKRSFNPATVTDDEVLELLFGKGNAEFEDGWGIPEEPLNCVEYLKFEEPGFDPFYLKFKWKKKNGKKNV